ncbi:UNVERIFIED_CONTAM: hypothetical protein PYX00_003552 [Menopon gallinae]|uniref:Activating signal cointegrator 1 complex subunit 3 n=1 Tax=Menopon gallinae TaxID=328185 RepID=A0AAW2I120_9NEOP
MTWLVNEIRKSMEESDSIALSPQNYAEAIGKKLTSPKSSDELQDELFEMLGFERFELIQNILIHRKEIIEQCDFDADKQEKATKFSDFMALETPVAGVVFHSKKDKLAQKAFKNDEKKCGKTTSKGKLDNDYLMNDDIPVIDTEGASRESIVRKSQKYPHVYDSQEKAKMTAGFIAGVKLMLPVGVEKKDGPGYEEVVIPVTEKPPPMADEKFVQISQLNKIGQIVFQGIKQLNRIQSIVFNTVYHTNNNLLICAPTGAGKTNVALLAVTREIEQHAEGNVIQKDAFKIVYVAPMKALAAEMTKSFGDRLRPLGLTVRELTGDMQLTKSEILSTQMLITTPEKWDVVTRKGTGDIALTKVVKLLIIDEVHLLHGDRGPVVESLVARTLRQVESSQSMIRIVGLSATLPNYLDVSRFLRVNPNIGLFFFDSRFRPVPLKQTFIGVRATKPLQQMNDMDRICYEKAVEQIQRGHQVMIFVHTRNATLRTANILKELATKDNNLHLFQLQDTVKLGMVKKTVMKLKNKQVADLLTSGISCHHAGMLRADRSVVEQCFSAGLIKVLVCTSTLAWGVNLPAHAVIIRGTEIYDVKHGSFVDLGILDVLQIFGRAGRPQYESSGHGIIITSYDKLNHYLSLLTNQFPIESNFIKFLADNLNAEIALGTISNVDEAIQWLSYTYLFVRMKVNPRAYGLSYEEVLEDPTLRQKRQELIIATARELDKAKMIRFNENTRDLNITDLGRTASHFYIKYDTVEVFNEIMSPVMDSAEILSLVSQAQEFEQLKIRNDELDELDGLIENYCSLEIKGGCENIHGKVNILLQTFLSRGHVESFSLMSDQSYIIQNAVRIARALFEIAVSKNNALMASRYLTIAKMLELQMWDFETPLKQFGIFGRDVTSKLEEKKLTVEKLRDMTPQDVGAFLRNPKVGRKVHECAMEIPLLLLNAELQPITRTVLRIRLKLTPDFVWNDKVHGKTSEAFWVWIEDPNSDFIYHSEYFLITKKQVKRREEQELVMTIPISDPPPVQYLVKVISDRWIGSEITEPLSFGNITLPESHPPHTDLLALQPLPITALDNPRYQQIYKFTHFNTIQTQIFHCLYHTDKNVLLGAPTGSGKTVVAEIAMFRVFRTQPGTKVVYIAPLKALVRERIEDWKVRLERQLKIKVVELTGDVSPDIRSITMADVIVTTPEKWDGISRSWQTRNYVRDVSLIVIDEIHLLGEDRGPVLEVIVSRTNFISSFTSRKLRIIGLSTALANAKDLADWLGIGQMGLYNFRPSVRPVPLEVHISGFPGKHYCPRMAAMNRPTFQAIRQHSPTQPALVFVSSRRQTRLTALDLISYLAGEDNPKQWLHMEEDEMDLIIDNTKDSNLKLTLAFGIGLHHAGLVERDRKTVEELFMNQKIQVLVATATLAWGVNFPAHLVVIKGTEYYDGKLKRYVDMPITDVLQMMGRAGRPQFDELGIAVVLVQDVKKNFYKKFLYEPFPVESSLLEVLPDHLNAEVVAGTIKTKQEALDYLTWTFFFRRLLKNPSYYNLEGPVEENVNGYLSSLVDKSFATLEESSCIEVEEDNRTVYSTSIGRIASFYYLSHTTVRNFKDSLKNDLNIEQLLQVLCNASEYDQLPVRHNEELLNADLAKLCPLPVNQYSLDSPNTKAQLLFQAHFSRLPMPCADYLTDLKSVLEQAVRILQAMIDMCAEQGWLEATLRIQQLMQMVLQASWIQASPLLILPHMKEEFLSLFTRHKNFFYSLPTLQKACVKNYSLFLSILQTELPDAKIEEMYNTLIHLPMLNVELKLLTSDGEETIDIPQPMVKGQWLKVTADEEYTLSVKLQRANEVYSSDTRAFTPRFPRSTDEGWFLTLGCIENRELIALKRAPRVGRNGVSPERHILHPEHSRATYLHSLHTLRLLYRFGSTIFFQLRGD